MSKHHEDMIKNAQREFDSRPFGKELKRRRRAEASGSTVGEVIRSIHHKFNLTEIQMQKIGQVLRGEL